jgi:hypothetical protein
MIPWDKLHGAMTHFPIALLLFSTACDFASVTFRKLSFARELRVKWQPYAGVVYFHMLLNRLNSAGNLAPKSLTNQLGVSNDAGRPTRRIRGAGLI